MISVNIIGVEQVDGADSLTLITSDGQDIMNYELEKASAQDDDTYLSTITPPSEVKRSLRLRSIIYIIIL